jgi:hypothetical protein
LSDNIGGIWAAIHAGVQIPADTPLPQNLMQTTPNLAPFWIDETYQDEIEVVVGYF